MEKFRDRLEKSIERLSGLVNRIPFPKKLEWFFRNGMKEHQGFYDK